MADEHLISLQPGTVIAGRYEVVKCLGAGSMGLVYACRHRELAGHLVAVKVLFPEVAQDKVAAARFRNEIFASYGVSHPNVVRAYEYIRDGDLTAYTMEYVGGGDLADRLGRPEDPISVSEVVQILSQMCLGVQAIHDSGIVHRDLKPENILLTKDGQVKIADFGIARMGHGPKLTEHGGVVGTIDYVSPEYMLNSHVDWRSDIYALGILAYEMITGESPFRGDSVYATMTKRLKSDPPPPGSIRKECPPELDRIVARAMHRDPEKRYQSAAEMYQDLIALIPQHAGGEAHAGHPPSGYGKGSTGPYVGPVVEPISDMAAVATTSTEQRVGAATESDRSVDFVVGERSAGQSLKADNPSIASTGRYSWQRNPHQSLEGIQGQGSDPFYGSVSTLNSEFEDLAEHYSSPDSDPTIHEPVRMERVLGYSNLITDTWERETKAPSVHIPQGGIDTNRVRKLSELVEKVHRSIWIDIATLVFAILIGILVGFVVLKLFAPHLLERGSDPTRGFSSTVTTGIP